MSEQQPIRLVIHPAPSDAEAAAISAAVSMTMAVGANPVEVPAVRNAWREAGKREALRDSHWETRK